MIREGLAKAADTASKAVQIYLITMPPPTPRLSYSRCETLVSPQPYLTISTAEGTNPASLSVLDISTSPSNVLFGNVVMKLATALPVSLCTICASSNSVVSAGSVLVMLPEPVCSLSRASLRSLLVVVAAARADGPVGGLRRGPRERDLLARPWPPRPCGGARPCRPRSWP